MPARKVMISATILHSGLSKVATVRKYADNKYIYGRLELYGGFFQSNPCTPALWRLQSQGKIVSPARGFFALVGTPYRKVGSPPPTWYIDPRMKFKKLPYYVGLLSAAAFHGSSHHAVMETKVIVPRPPPEQEIGSARFRFFVKGTVEKTPRKSRDTPACTVNISTPAATPF